MTAPASRPRLLFVTGKLAARALARTLDRLAPAAGFHAEIFVAKISVAALITPEWLVGKLVLPDAGVDRIILPGLCAGDLDALSKSVGAPVERGPIDLAELPAYFQQPASPAMGYGAWDIEILAEINHANRLAMDELARQAMALRASGADVVDLGCTPGEPWNDIEAATRDLVGRGLRVSVDSFHPAEVAAAARAGAELVLSVNASNRDAASDWGCEVVVIPDQPQDRDWLDSVSATVDRLEAKGVRWRLDPILEPIGFGFAASLGRYLETRRAFPNAEILMGVGNLTELTAVDSAGVNAMLVGFCQEIGVRSVLTTQVIPWARSSVRELTVARQLMKHAVDHRVLPKRVDDRLVMLRDPRLPAVELDQLRDWQRQMKDLSVRLFADDDGVIAINAEKFERDDDPFALFDRLDVHDPRHAFYLGWEMMKATLARQLGKRYVQDRALRWGLLTREETSHRDRPRDETP